jgi:hypothetical protein
MSRGPKTLQRVIAHAGTLRRARERTAIVADKP